MCKITEYQDTVLFSSGDIGLLLVSFENVHAFIRRNEHSVLNLSLRFTPNYFLIPNPLLQLIQCECPSVRNIDESKCSNNFKASCFNPQNMARSIYQMKDQLCNVVHILTFYTTQFKG